MNTTEVKTDVVKTKSFITKYWKILLSVIIIVFLFSLYGNISSCMKGKKVVPVDTLQAYLQKEKQIELVLLSQVEKLKTLHKTDSLRYVQLEASRADVQIVYIHTQDSARRLPLTGAVDFMAQNLKDRENIKMQVSKQDTTISIVSKNVYDINSMFISNKFLVQDNSLLKSEVAISTSKDSVSCIIIKNYETLLKDKSSVEEVLQEQNTVLNKNLTSMTKSMKRQKFFKNVFEATTLAAIIFAALK